MANKNLHYSAAEENEKLIEREVQYRMKLRERGRNGKSLGKPNSFGGAIWEFFATFVIAAIAVVLLFSFVGKIAVVDGPSMEGTLHDGEYLLVSNLLYHPKSGDVIVFQGAYATYTDPLVKRVIAAPGQQLSIDFNAWTITVDGEKVDESEYVQFTDDGARINVVSAVWGDKLTVDENGHQVLNVTVPAGRVFVMGDNRNHSADSRVFGFVSTADIIGKVYFRVFPFNTIGLVK